MNDINTSTGDTHENQQKILLIGLIYFLLVIGLTCYIAFSEVLYAPYIMNAITDDDDKYSPKFFFLLNLLATGLILYPFYWLAKRAVSKNRVEGITANENSLSIVNQKVFTFTYSSIVSTVTMDDLFVQIKRGFVNRTYPLDKLRNFFWYRQKRYSTMYINFDGEDGKLDKILMHALPGDAQIDALNAELESRFLGKSLNHSPQRDAFKILRQANPVMMGIVVVVIVLLVLGGIFGFLLAR